MKPVWKLSATLLLNQFLADIACGMCAIPFPFMFGESKFTYILLILFIGFFFYYISYHGAYKVGFHDESKHSSNLYDKGYIKRGFLASLIAAAPTILLFVLWYIGKSFGIAILHALQMPLFFWTLYGSWPITNLIPNHMATAFLICMAVQLVFPLIGYYSGYRGIVYSDYILKWIGLDKKNKL